MKHLTKQEETALFGPEDHEGPIAINTLRTATEYVSKLIEINNELLGTCKSLFDSVCFGDHGNIVDGPYICVGKPHIDALRAAIAKAEGR